MDSLMEILTAISAVAIAAAAVMAVIELRGIRHVLEEHVFIGDPTVVLGSDEEPGHAIFICKEGQWVLAADMSGPGCHASRPTTEPSFEGQVVKRASVPD